MRIIMNHIALLDLVDLKEFSIISAKIIIKKVVKEI